MNIGVNGLPSQISNDLAMKEGFLSAVGTMRGLPLGASFSQELAINLREPHIVLD